MEGWVGQIYFRDTHIRRTIRKKCLLRPTPVPSGLDSDPVSDVSLTPGPLPGVRTFRCPSTIVENSSFLVKQNFSYSFLNLSHYKSVDEILMSSFYVSSLAHIHPPRRVATHQTLPREPPHGRCPWVSHDGRKPSLRQ